MKKKSKVILLSAGICIALGIGIIWAYYSNNMSVINPLLTGNANVYLDETFDVNDKWVPGEEKQKEVIFGNDGEVDVVIRAKFTPKLFLKDGIQVTDVDVLNGFQLNYSKSFEEEWEKHDDGWYYYKKVLKPDEKTNQTLISVTMNNNISNDVHGQEIDYSNSDLNVDIECETIQATVSKDSSDLQNWDYYPVVSETGVSWIKK